MPKKKHFRHFYSEKFVCFTRKNLVQIFDIFGIIKTFNLYYQKFNNRYLLPNSLGVYF
jgi:hypothetical protein